MFEKLMKQIQQEKIPGVLYLIWVALFAITFYKDSVLINILRATAIYAFFVLPPYLYYLSQKKDDLMTLFFYCCMYAGTIFVSSYYLGILGLKIQNHIYVIPAIAIGYSLYLLSRNK